MNKKINAPKLKFITSVLALILMALPMFPVYAAGTDTTTSGSTKTPTTATADPAKPKSPTVPHPELAPPPDSTTTTPATNTTTPTTSTNPTSPAATTTDTTQAANTNTGTASDNTAKAEQKTGTDITNNNDANVANSVDAAANSGENDASYNTGNAGITTGDADVTLTILNMINSIFAGINGGQMSYIFKNIYGDMNGNYIIDPASGEAYSLTGARIDTSNTATGPLSQNTALVNSNQGTTITNNNNGNLTNNVNLSANTGGNTADYNTGTGKISTGDANVALNLVNFINSSFVVTQQGVFLVLNIFGDWLGNLLVPKSLLSGSGGTTGAVIVNNTNTGAVSVNGSAVNTTNNTGISNTNNANISNNINMNANTGGNDASYNTKGGAISTGDVLNKLNLTNFANQNIVGNFVMLMVNVLGTWSGQNLLPGMNTISANSDPNVLSAANNATGTGSGNTALVNSNNGTTINNNNTGLLNNNINLSANTGNNSASYNTGSGLISTGNASILANVLNFMNMNVVSGKGLYVIVNVFGNWTGNIDTLKEAPAGKLSQVIVGLTPKHQANTHYYVTVPNGKAVADGTVLSANTDNGNQQNVVAAADSASTDLTKNAEATNSNYSPIEFVKSYLKIIVPILIVGYIAFIALYYRKRSSHF